MIYIDDITVNEYSRLDEERQDYFKAIYDYLSPLDEYYGDKLDIMDESFTFKKSIDIKLFMSASTLQEQIDIFEKIYNKEKGFVFNKSMCNFTRSLKWVLEQIKRIRDIEAKMLTSQLEKKHSGYGEDRLEKFEWINIADTIATRYKITPFDVLNWGWYDTMVIMRYIDTTNYVSVKFNDLLLTKK